jgi:anaerobic selenocysteine-containing dehydrogenase
MPREIQTACTYDCPDACCLRAQVADDGRITLKGDPDHPITRGFVCSRIRKHPDRLHASDRLTRPLRRTASGELSPIGWDEALDLAARELSAALQEHGPHSVVHLGGGGSLGLSKYLVGHFFRSLGPITTLAGGVCGEAGEAAQKADFGEVACHDYTDLEHSRAVVLWGKNPVATGTHLVPFIKAARERGAPVALIDPVPLESARLADRVISVAPGRDADLALALLGRLRREGRLDPTAATRVEALHRLEALLERPELSPEACAARAGVDDDDLAWLAELYAARTPVATWIGWGLQRCGAGGAAVRCIDALALLSGNLGRPGGGANFSSRRSRGLDRTQLAPALPGGRSVAAARLGAELEGLDDPPARFVYVALGNPVTQFADSLAIQRALQRCPFVVAVDAFLTDTARAADLILPVTLMLEEDDVVGSYQHHHVARVRRVVEPPGEARDDLWILRELGRRLGLPEDPLLTNPAAALERMAAPWFSDCGADAGFVRNPAQPVVPFAERFATPSGKARLIDAPPPTAAPEDPDYPLTLMSISSRRWQTSQLPEAEQQGLAECLVHPTAAAAAGLADGATARLESPLGGIDVRLRLKEALHPEACVVYRGGWVACGRGINALVQGRSTDLGGGTAFFDQRVRLVEARQSAG